MKTIQYLMMAVCLIATVSCRKDTANLDVDLSTYNSDDFVNGPLDEWLYTHLTVPYNIEVKYRFDRSMGDISRNIAPTDIEKVQPTAEMILDGFIKVYEKVAGPAFIKTYTPKQFALWGSLTYNTNNTVTLGTASAGRRVVLYDVNNLDTKNPENVKRRLRTIYHEFTHILNQLVAIPPTFENVTPGDYTGDWTNSANTEAEAQQLGFVSRYARDQYSEDFAEVAAHLLVEGQTWFDLYVAGAGEDGAAKLRQKEAIVVDYFKQYFNIEFIELQNEVANAIDQISPPVPFASVFRSGGVSGISNMNPLNQEVASDDFLTVWNQAVEGVAAVRDEGRSLNDVSLIFESPTEMTVRFYYNNSSGTNYVANVTYTIEISEDGTTVLGPADGNTSVIASGLQPVLDYLKSGAFRAQWATRPVPGSAGILAGFFKVGDENSYFYGTIE